jgi:heat shock protein HtpX
VPEGLLFDMDQLILSPAPFPGVSRATQHLFIVNPINTFTSKSSALLATHLDVADRIARLRNLGA